MFLADPERHGAIENELSELRRIPVAILVMIQHISKNWMLNVGKRFDDLSLAVRKAVRIIEAIIDRDIDMFVDSRR